MNLSSTILDILVCPKCKGELTIDHDKSGLVCSRCRLRYPVRDGMPIMLIDEAEKLGE